LTGLIEISFISWEINFFLYFLKLR
jgi:hypothetical protein